MQRRNVELEVDYPSVAVILNCIVLADSLDDERVELASPVTCGCLVAELAKIDEAAELVMPGLHFQLLANVYNARIVKIDWRKVDEAGCSSRLFHLHLLLHFLVEQ